MEAELVRVPTGSGWHPQVGNGGELKKRTVYRCVRRVKRSQYGMVQHRRAGISREPLPPWPEGAQRGMVLGTKEICCSFGEGLLAETQSQHLHPTGRKPREEILLTLLLSQVV